MRSACGFPPSTGRAATVLDALGALVATSANLPGRARPEARCEDVPAELVAAVDAVVDGGELPGTPSTVIDLTGPSRRCSARARCPPTRRFARLRIVNGHADAGLNACEGDSLDMGRRLAVAVVAGLALVAAPQAVAKAPTAVTGPATSVGRHERHRDRERRSRRGGDELVRRVRENDLVRLPHRDAERRERHGRRRRLGAADAG